MIRFSCPRCGSIREQPDDAAGVKLACPDCGQRLQVPLPPENQTVLAHLVPVQIGPPEPRAGRTPGGPEFTTAGAEVRTVNGREHLCWPCLQCQGEVQVAVEAAPTSMPCPHCGRRIAVPQRLPPEPPALPGSSWQGRAPAADDGGRFPQPPAFGPRNAEGPRRRPRYDEGEDDYGERFARPPGLDPESYTRSAVVGVACSLAGLALLLLSFFLGVVAQATILAPQRALIWVGFCLVLGSFVLCLLGTVFGGRGMNPANTENRGLATAGLACGIVGLVLSAIAGLFLFCAGLLGAASGPPYWRWR